MAVDHEELRALYQTLADAMAEVLAHPDTPDNISGIMAELMANLNSLLMYSERGDLVAARRGLLLLALHEATWPSEPESYVVETENFRLTVVAKGKS